MACSDARGSRIRDVLGEPRGIQVREVSAHTTVTTLIGGHDLASQQQVIDALVQAIDRPNIIVDLTYCTFADTSILDALYAARRAQQPGRDRIVLVIPDHNGFVNRWGQLTGVTLAFQTYAALDEALCGLGEPLTGRAGLEL